MRRLVFVFACWVLGATAAAAQQRCPRNFEGATEAVACTCAAEDSRDGNVWGSGPYTTDSRVCRAAVHAGVIPPTGGLIHVFPAPGAPSYRGTAANGVTSMDYGSWGGSFTVFAPGGTAARPLTACPSSLPEDSRDPIACVCTPEAAGSGSVWGTGTYTSDSRICRAAVHAGAIPATGGTVTVTPAPGRASYDPSTANGVTSSRYGAWSASFTVAPVEAPPPRAAVDGPPACPSAFGGQAAPLSCTCSAEAAASGSVWGTGVYTTDSRICRAALHAGAITAKGGVVTVAPVPGLPSYFGTAQNGVTSANYGPWSASFTFRR